MLLHCDKLFWRCFMKSTLRFIFYTFTLLIFMPTSLFAQPERFINNIPFLSSQSSEEPLSILDDHELLTYDYLWDSTDTKLAFTLPTPFSRNIDRPERHLYQASPRNLTTIPSHIASFGGEELLSTTLKEVMANKDYIAYVDNTHFQTVYPYMQRKLSRSPYHNIFVTFRRLDTYVYPNQVLDLVTYPVSVDFTPTHLDLTIGEDTLSYHTLWTAYYPTHSLTSFSVDKTLDATLMRAFYEYYRNLCHLRDDAYFIPFEVITNQRTNVFSHQVYSRFHDGSETPYTIRIYRVHPTGSMHYIIDILKDESDSTSDSSFFTI